MDFRPSERAAATAEAMWHFMHEHIFPAEKLWAEHLVANGPHSYPSVMEDLKNTARGLGLWNLFLPKYSGMTNLEYATIAEISGWSPIIAPEAINCQAPDTGNMETLELFATPEQRDRWLTPLLEGRIRSAFAMSEPDVASSDATNISLTMTADGDGYILNGTKWWITGAADSRCEVFIVMARSDADAPAHRQHSVVLVPRACPGLTVGRSLPILGFQDQHGHCELHFDEVRIPRSALLAEEGDGFKIAQARLGPGRIHHAMRALGMAERALALLVQRAKDRVAFGQALVDQGVVQEHIARSRIEIDQARLLVLKAAWLIDEHGVSGARTAVAEIKVAAPAVANAVIDRAIEVHGAAGLGDTTPLAYFHAWARALRVVDGPDAVHLRSIARSEILGNAS